MSWPPPELPSILQLCPGLVGNIRPPGTDNGWIFVNFSGWEAAKIDGMHGNFGSCICSGGLAEVMAGGSHQTRAQFIDELGASRSHGDGVDVTPLPPIIMGVVGGVAFLPLPITTAPTAADDTAVRVVVVQSSGADECQGCGDEDGGKPPPLPTLLCSAFMVSRYGWSGSTLVCPNLVGMSLGLTWWRCSRAIWRRTVLLRVKVRWQYGQGTRIPWWRWRMCALRLVSYP